MTPPAVARSGILALILALAAPAVAQSGPAVVASTSWTAAIARAAGLRDVTALAPADMQHPPEYALKPSDLLAAARADIVVYAGYESFAPRLLEAVGNEGATLVQVRTDNAPDVLVAQARAVAEVAGTVPAFERWRASFERDVAALRERVAGAPPERAVVHAMMRPQAEALGYTVVGTFGPGQLTPGDLVALRAQAPTLIVDNLHAPVGRGLAADSDARYVAFINFPGTDGTATLLDVLRRNADLATPRD